MTYTTTATRTFTRTSALYITSKVAADLRRLRSYYGRPSEELIGSYVEELTTMLAGGYIKSVEYGFRRNGQRVVALRYEVNSSGVLTTDSSAGGVYARADVSDASWFSYLENSTAWSWLTDQQRGTIEAGLPIKRTAGDPPRDGVGYWVTDRSYYSDGTAVQRQTFRPL